SRRSGESTLTSAGSGNETSPGNSCSRLSRPAWPSASCAYSAIRRALGEPASRDGISPAMCSRCRQAASTERSRQIASSVIAAAPLELRVLRRQRPAGQEAAVARQDRAVDEGGLVGDQEADRL